MNRTLEDNFDFNDHDDYKMAWCEQERLRQENSINGWIYVGLDTRYNNMAKIGLTTGQLGTRASGSQNPFYALLCAFKIKEGVAAVKVSEIEVSIINYLSHYYNRINHITYEKYSWEMYSYHCSERDIGVIYSWENKQFLSGAPRNPYQANDLSSPPVDSACCMPGGCGEDCDCWD